METELIATTEIIREKGWLYFCANEKGFICIKRKKAGRKKKNEK